MIVETCPLLDELSWVRHGFFGRDNAHAVTNDLVGIKQFTDDFPQTLFLPQTHSDCITQAEHTLPKCADASITDQHDMALAVKTADCAPVLLACRKTKLIAAVHAGWPGALNQITLKTVQQMKQNGANPAHIVAAIGPCLQVDTFPVQADVRDKFQGQLPEALDFLIPFEDRWKLDMVGIVTQQLKKAGVADIWASKTNTLTNKDFSSYRRRNNDPASEKTRNVSVILKINT